MQVCKACAFSCVQLCDPMDYSPPGSSVHGIFQTKFTKKNKKKNKKKNTGVSCRFLLQRIFPTQESNPNLLHLLHWQADSLSAEPLGITDCFLNVSSYLFVCSFPVLSSHSKFCERRRSMPNAIQAQSSAWWIMGAQKYYMRKRKIEQMSPCKADSLSSMTD